MISNHSLFVPGTWSIKYLLPAALILFLSFGNVAPAVAVGSNAHHIGKFGPLHDWPIIPIAMMLMPDGRVLAYGTDTTGAQIGNLLYVIWNPSLGIETSAFETLPNITHTDIYCAGQALIPDTGHGLFVGGEAKVNTIKNYSHNSVNIFDPSTDTLTQSQSMAFKRWYATAVTLPNGEHVVLGGRSMRKFFGTSTIPATVAAYSPTPEVRAQDGHWRSLSSATSDTAYGAAPAGEGLAWFYPRAWVNPQGSVFILGHDGAMFKLNPLGTGALSKYASTITPGLNSLPSIMFAPGRILSVRSNRIAHVININRSGEPVVSSGGILAKDRQYSNATVLANGWVWINGGSSTGNDLAGAALDSELWNPYTGVWKTAANATTARLYHSTSLLLPDGSVITGGGGTPGPLTQLNGEIYYPPYLFKKDGSGQFAPRPVIVDAPTTMIGWNQTFSIEATDNIAKVTLARIGATTHAFNNETRFFSLPASSADSKIVTVRSPASAKVAPPGFYMLFVWNAGGIPSVAKIIQIG
ncbi:glyoxal oxidase-like protein [Nitrosomonas sp. Nm84]|uniref:glyoxal oxidase n=1 Tax=Nitrosomonas sp. Nm84 TaxID=200124 RepID=UPI000D758FD6|nr:glyoxal oxidase [Nitrosomonas sp. Nm84]PXW80511.1 glyoxal oxidase-like protein [Nitrosomonas sp. Nm84]